MITRHRHVLCSAAVVLLLAPYQRARSAEGDSPGASVSRLISGTLALLQDYLAEKNWSRVDVPRGDLMPGTIISERPGGFSFRSRVQDCGTVDPPKVTETFAGLPSALLGTEAVGFTADLGFGLSLFGLQTKQPTTQAKLARVTITRMSVFTISDADVSKFTRANEGTFYRFCANEFRSSSDGRARMINEALVVSGATLELLDEKGSPADTDLGTSGKVKFTSKGAGRFEVEGAGLVFAYKSLDAASFIPPKRGKLTISPGQLKIERTDRYVVTLTNEGTATLVWLVRDRDGVLGRGLFLEAPFRKGLLKPLSVTGDIRDTQTEIVFFFILLSDQLPKRVGGDTALKLEFEIRSDDQDPQVDVITLPIELRASTGPPADSFGQEWPPELKLVARAASQARLRHYAAASRALKAAFELRPSLYLEPSAMGLAMTVLAGAGTSADRSLSTAFQRVAAVDGLPGVALPPSDWQLGLDLVKARTSGAPIASEVKARLVARDGWSATMVEAANARASAFP